MFIPNSIIEIDHILDVEKHIDNLNAIVFDLDDTLYSEKDYVRSGYKAISKLFPQMVGVEQKLWDFFVAGKPAIDEFLIIEGITDNKTKQECLQVYRYQIPEIILYNGVKEMLVNLAKTYKLGLITDGRPEGQRAKIKALDIEQYFDCIIITDELGGVETRKPNPLAFQLMHERLAIPYNEMCYIGDNINKDFIAPQRFGMRSIWFKNNDGIYNK